MARKTGVTIGLQVLLLKAQQKIHVFFQKKVLEHDSSTKNYANSTDQHKIT